MIKLTSKNLRLVLLGSIGLAAVIFMAIMFLGLSMLSSKSHQMVDLKVKSDTVNAQLSSLEVAKKQVEKYGYFKDVAKTVIPSDKNEAQTVLDIFQIADQTGIGIDTITFPSSTLGINSSTGASTQDATSSTSTKAAISQAVPVSGIPGLYSLELTIQPTISSTTYNVTYDNMINFLTHIENDRRTAQISSITIEPPTANQGLEFKLSINTFLKP